MHASICGVSSPVMLAPTRPCRFAVLGIFGSLCDVVLLPTTEGLPPSFAQLSETLVPSDSSLNITAVASSCFASSSLLPALGIDLGQNFAQDTDALLREANPQRIANLSGPVMTEAVAALDLTSATLAGNEVTPTQLQLLGQACQQCNITQWRLTVKALGLDLPCGQDGTDCASPQAGTCKNQFCQGEKFGNAVNVLINTTLDNMGQVRKDLASLNTTVGLTGNFATDLPSAVHRFIDKITATANSITCSFMKVAYTQSAYGLCRTSIDGYQAATNSVLGAAMALSAMVCVQIIVNIRLGGVGSGAPPVRVFAVPSRGSIQIGETSSVSGDGEHYKRRSTSVSTENSQYE